LPARWKQTTAIVEKFPELSRFGVMKHLQVLRDAGLVLTHEEGRTCLNFLNAVPIRLIYERWGSKFADHWATTLIRLKESIEGSPQLNFSSLDEVVADAEKLLSSPHTRTLGNWPLGQLLTHLAMGINTSINGISFVAPWYARLFGYFFKGRILRRGLPPGIKMPKALEADAYPPAPSLPAALATLRQAVARTKTEHMTARHPVLGKLTHEEWLQFHLRHAELHLSFAELKIPAWQPAST